jgi:hypothetical protein
VTGVTRLDHCGGVLGNREVPHLELPVARGDRRAARDRAYPREGGPRGKQGFPRRSEPEASDVIDAYLGTAA